MRKKHLLLRGVISMTLLVLLIGALALPSFALSRDYHVEGFNVDYTGISSFDDEYQHEWYDSLSIDIDADFMEGTYFDTICSPLGYLGGNEFDFSPEADFEFFVSYSQYSITPVTHADYGVNCDDYVIYYLDTNYCVLDKGAVLSVYAYDSSGNSYAYLENLSSIPTSSDEFIFTVPSHFTMCFALASTNDTADMGNSCLDIYAFAVDSISPFKSFAGGYQDGYDVGEDYGYNDGYDDGYDVGEVHGYDVGHEDGFLEGVGHGYEYGHSDGYDDGYRVGYTESQDDNETAKSLFFSILDAPFKIIRDVLNFEIFGVNISALVFGLITLGIILFIVKRFF